MAGVGRPLPRIRHLLPLLLLAVFALCACKLKVTPVVSTGGHQITADGVTYIVPWEEGSHNDMTGFEYKGESVQVSSKGGALTVDGKSYGAVRPGDTVDLTTKGTVLINGQSRQPK